ncbi:uncharacterized protein LJ264_015292 [Porphyrio hochstetteri]
MTGCPFHVSPGDVDQEVFRELPEAIQQELLSGETEAIPPENAAGEASVWFPAGTCSTVPNSKGVKSCSTGCNPHLTSALLPHSPRASSSAECPTSTGTSSGVEKAPPASLSCRGSELSALEAGLSQTILPVPVLDKEKQGFETTSEEQTWSREAGVGLPPDIDTKTFHELPLDVQEELLAEWKKQESNIPLDKPPEKPTARKGKRNRAPGSAQSNSLLRYFKPH